MPRDGEWAVAVALAFVDIVSRGREMEVICVWCVVLRGSWRMCFMLVRAGTGCIGYLSLLSFRALHHTPSRLMWCQTRPPKFNGCCVAFWGGGGAFEEQ